MRRMKPETKRKIVAVIAVLLVITMVLALIAPFFSAANVFAADSNQYTIEARLGFDGAVKIENSAPVSIKVTNNSGTDFKGRAAIEITRTDYNYSLFSSSEQKSTVEYFSDLELAAGETKLIEGKIPVETIESEYVIKLIDKNEKIVYSHSADTVTDSLDNVWLGVLSDSDKTINEISKNYTQYAHQLYLNRLVEMTESDIDYLSNINILVVNDLDMDSLDNTQLSTFSSWINNGGVLVVGDADPENSKWFANITKGNAVSVSSSYMWENNSFTNLYNGTALEKFVAVMQDYVDPSYWQSLSDAVNGSDDEYILKLASLIFYYGDLYSEKLEPLLNDITLAYSQNSDSAVLDTIANEYDSVVYSQYDFAMYDFYSQDGSSVTYTRQPSGNDIYYELGEGKIYTFAPDELAQDLLYTEISMASGYNNVYNKNYYYDDIGLEKPKDIIGGAFFGLLMLYAIFIGPILYLILKSHNKKEKAVIYVPVSALIITAVIIVIGLGSMYQRPLANVVNMVDASKGGIRPMEGRVVCSAPVAGDLNIKNDVLGSASLDESNFMYSDKNKSYRLALDRFDYTIQNARKWDTTRFKYKDDIELTGGLDVAISSLDIGSGPITFVITNNTGYDLKDICICADSYNSTYLVAKDLKAGDSFTYTGELSYYNYAFSSSAINNQEYDAFNKMSINKRTAAGSPTGDIKVTGFVESDIAGDFKINGRKANKTEVNAFYVYLDNDAVNAYYGY